MNATHPHQTSIAARDAACAGAGRLDSGLAAGMVVVDANRPAPRAGCATAQPLQAGGALH